MDLSDPGGWFGLVDVLVPDQERVEKRLVEQSSDVWAGLLVGDVGVLQEFEGLFEGLHNLGCVLGGYLCPAMSLAALDFDAVLLGSKDLLGNRAFVEQMQELLLLVLEFLEPSGVAG